MAADPYTCHSRSEVELDADAPSVFAFLDDHFRLASHMEKPTLMMAGGSMRVETDALQGKAVGSVIHMTGRVFGADLAVDEVVTERVPPFHKTWQTRGRPQLLVIGAYRMGFVITPVEHRSRLIVFIDYQLPPRGFDYVLGRLVGRAYAQWCIRRIAADAVKATAGAARL